MWIVCDTNIWYYVASDEIVLPEEHYYEIPITVIEEFVITPKQNLEHEYVKKALQGMMKKGDFPQNKKVNYMEPFHYFVTIDTKGHSTPMSDRVKNFLNYTDEFANDKITDEIRDLTKEYRENRKNYYKKFASIINDNGDIIKAGIKDKEAHKLVDASESIKEMIKNWVEHLTGHELSAGFNWGMVELFCTVLDVFFKNIELGKNSMTQNDVIDLLNLIYVQPGKLYWTREKKWIKLIKQAGMEKYLYVE